MAGWKQVLTKMTDNAESRFDELRYRLYYALGGPGPIKIIPYRGYGTPERLYLKGRVIEDKNIAEATENDRLWNNLINMYKRLESDEVPHARVKVMFQGHEQEVVADEEGFFEAWVDVQEPLKHPDRLWHLVDLELISPQSDKQTKPVKAVAEMLIPPSTARYVVVSDVDDTVLQTDAVHMIKMARHVFLGNAHTRLPFPGVAGLYRALFAGQTGADNNPLFYVSSSPWNLYDLLAQFFNLHSIPVGPVLFLRDWGISETEILPIKHREFKTTTIRKMLDFYPNLPFVLVGDSGQEDPEIYAEIAGEYKSRILATYIRNVSRDIKRPESIQKLAQKVIEAGSSLVLADDSMAIAKHALGLKLINENALPSVQVEKEKDEAPPTIVDELLDKEEEGEAPTIKVENKHPEQTKQAIKEGAIEETVKQAAKEETTKPPTVVVESKDSKDNASRKTGNE